MARRKEAHGGGHGWFVTFADLMGLLVSFFVMLVAFSNQDSQKVQAVAGSMRDAFGVQKNVRLPGITEFEGLPTRAKLKNSVHIAPEDSSATPTPNEGGSSFVTDKAFNLAAASLRQALQSLPELPRLPNTLSSRRRRRDLTLSSWIKTAPRCSRKARKILTSECVSSSRSLQSL